MLNLNPLLGISASLSITPIFRFETNLKTKVDKEDQQWPKKTPCCSKDNIILTRNDAKNLFSHG